MREQKANDNGFPVVGEQAKEKQIFPFEQLVEYDGAANKITINANVTINGDTNIGELDIDSGDAPKGQVLTADGDSGASWENRVAYLNLESESGNLTNAQIEVAEQDNVIITLDGQFYYKNSQSDEVIVFKAPAKVVDDDTIAEKVVIDLSDNTYSYSYEVVSAGSSFDPVYDDELNDSSTNAVQNKVIYEALEQKANTEDLENGQLVVAKSLTTKQVENVSEDSGSTQTDPFLFQATGTNNNTTETPTAPVAKQLELRGNSVVVNQLVQNGNFASTDGWSVYQANVSASSNVCTITATARYGRITHTLTTNSIKDHQYLITADVKLTTGTPYVILKYAIDGTTKKSIPTVSNTSWQTLTGIVKADSSNSCYVRIQDDRESDWDAIQVKNVQLIDLTQWFNDNIPQDILDHPEKFINYYQGSLAYNTGTIVDCNATELDTIEFNQWDEEWESGAINVNDGTNYPDANRIRSKNYIQVIANTNYCFTKPANKRMSIIFYDNDKKFISNNEFVALAKQVYTTPKNCIFIRFMFGDSTTPVNTYNHDICINLSWDRQRDGEYQPFVKHTYALGNDVLKSAGSVYDSKSPDGTITRRIGSYTFTGNESWTYIADDRWQISSFPQGQKTGAFVTSSNGLKVILTGSSLRVLLSDNPQITSSTNMNQVFPNGTVINFEIAEATTEQGTAFAENIVVDDYGTMEFVNTNGVPQGNKFFYPADYVLLMDDLNNYLDDNDKGISDLAFKSEISDSALAERGYLKLASLSGYDATKTQTLKNIEGVFTWVDDE